MTIECDECHKHSHVGYVMPDGTIICDTCHDKRRDTEKENEKKKNDR